MKTPFLVLIVIAALFEGIGDSVLKKWALEQKSLFFALGIGLYLVAAVMFAYSLKYEFLSKAISVVTILNLLLVVAVGVLYFNEDLSIINKVGILLGIISIVLIEA